MKIYLLQDGPTDLKGFFVTKLEGKTIIVTLRAGYKEPVSTSSYMELNVENLNNGGAGKHNNKYFFRLEKG